MSSFGIVIMAAGKGTRLRSQRPKVLHEVGGKALLLHVIEAARAIVPANDIVVVVGHQADRVEEAVRSTGVQFAPQTEQLGTGHALRCVQQWFDKEGRRMPEHLLVLSGDVPLIRPETISGVRAAHLRENAAMTILTAIPPDPTGYGRVLRRAPGSPEVLGIVEQKSLTPEQLSKPELLREINSGIYAFRTSALLPRLAALTNTNSAGEYYLTDVAAMLVESGERVIAVAAESVDEVLGANTIAEMMHLDSAMRMSKVRELMASGVTVLRPETVTVDASVQVGADTVLEPFSQLLGNTRIGSGCRIRSYSVIENCTLGDSVMVKNGCILSDSVVESAAVLGPYAHLRPQSHIGPRAHVGNFVETKKTTLGAGSKANHLSYLGDAVIGTGVNIGAGAITCNYDGVQKLPTTIEDNVFVGSDTTLIAPLTLGAGSYVAAGSCVTHDVPAGSLAIGRSRQVTKEGWADQRRTSARKSVSG